MSPESRFSFLQFSKWMARATGHPAAFVLALVVVVAWAITGPVFHFSDAWQLVINTGTTIVTFMMVFLIQNSQNRDTQALQLKLDELIRATKGAHNAVIDLEERTDDELSATHADYIALAEEARRDLQHRHPDVEPSGKYEPARPPPGAEVETRPTPEKPREANPADQG